MSSLLNAALVNSSHKDELNTKVKDLVNASVPLHSVKVNEGLRCLWVSLY